MDQKEMHQLQGKCLQEEPPACTAACPVHVDARGIALAVRKKDYATGFALFQKMVSFPRILSKICDQPCRQACKRKDFGGSIAVNELERYCVNHSARPAAKILPARAKEQKVAVVGGGLSGLTAAVELAKKGYPTVLYEATERVGGQIWDIAESRLPRQDITEDSAIVEKLPLLEIRYNFLLDGVELCLAKLCEEYDAVYIGVGSKAGLQPHWGLEMDDLGRPVIDPLTLATSHPKVFAGGSLIMGSESYSPVTSISHGKIAANSIDRLFQGASLTANREREGPYPTLLYTNTKGVQSQPAIMASDPAGYNEEEAGQEAARCLQCECLECVKVCEFLANYGSYPKKYIREVYNNLSIVMGIRSANKMINSCTLCGLCEKVCPNGLDMSEIYKAARQIMVKKGKMPPSPHDFILRDMQFSTSDKFLMHRHQPGFTQSRVMFFPGCQLSASSPQHVRKIYDYLCSKLEGGVGLSLGCCGAPADWAGQEELFRQTFQELEKSWHDFGRPKVVTGCPTCYSIFKREIPQMEVETIWTLLEDIGLPEKTGEGVAPKKLAVHDACTTRNDTKLHESIRKILQKLGHDVTELDASCEYTSCCGYGGLQVFANRELADKTAERRLQESEDDYLAYCAMCRDIFAGRGKRVYHLLDLIYPAQEGVTAGQKGPGYSARHENRARLKESLLKEVWGETVAEWSTGVKLVISDAVREVMEDRMILEEDIAKVIAHAEESGNKFRKEDSGSFIAYFKPVSVTYWVEYSPSDEGYVVHNAYSHRLEIKE